MMQIYFLSVFLNILAGYILISEEDKFAQEINIGVSLKDDTVKFVVGILSMVVGVLKLLSPVKGNIIIFGDLFPAITGFAAGAILCINYYQKNTTVEEEDKKPLRDFLLRNRKIIGFTVIIAAVLHFLFPDIILL